MPTDLTILRLAVSKSIFEENLTLAYFALPRSPPSPETELGASAIRVFTTKKWKRNKSRKEVCTSAFQLPAENLIAHSLHPCLIAYCFAHTWNTAQGPPVYLLPLCTRPSYHKQIKQFSQSPSFHPLSPVPAKLFTRSPFSYSTLSSVTASSEWDASLFLGCFKLPKQKDSLSALLHLQRDLKPPCTLASFAPNYRAILWKRAALGLSF